MTTDHRTLGGTGIRVSDLCLGTMTFGTAWGWGADEPTCRKMYEAFREAGGNYVDTANKYTNGESEEIVGRLIASERDDVVVATKFTLPASDDANSGGSHRKSLRRNLETSLRRLGTDHVDLLFVHAWDQRTRGDETLRALDDLVRAGTVLAIGVSNTPAWVVAHRNAVAELRGWTSFAAMQIEYSVARRTPDREVLPMAKALGLSVAAWSPLSRGLLAGKPRPEGAPPLQPLDQAAVDACAAVAFEQGVSSARVALAWVLHHGLTPVLGASSVEQLTDNLGAADLELGSDQIRRLDEAGAVELGYPHDFVSAFYPMLTAGIEGVQV